MWYRSFILSCAALALQSTAHAAVIGGGVTGGDSLDVGGLFVELDPNSAFTVGNNTFQDPNLYAFDEDQNIVIPSDIAVDIGTSPMEGEVVASHYVFFDPLSTTSQMGFVDFDAPIFGVATSTANLAASDFLLNNSVTYLNPTLRGLESQDFVGIDPNDGNRLLVDWSASTPGDYVRVFTMESPTAADPNPSIIPLPASGALLLAGLGLVALRRPSRQR